MTKLLSYLAAFLLLVVYILSTLYIERGNKITVLETQKNALNGNINYLEAEIEKRNEKALDTYKRVQTLERAAEKAKDKGGFDWNYNIAGDLVIIKLKEQGKNDR